MNDLRLHAILAFLVAPSAFVGLLGACGSSFSAGDVPDAGPIILVPPGSGDAAGIDGARAFDVTPGDSKLGILRAISFKASAPATWRVQEGSAGGTIDSTGRYVAPATPGTYHVIAIPSGDPTITRTITLTIVGLAISVIGGVVGGCGNVDGPARSAQFSVPAGFAYVHGSPDVLLVSDEINNSIRKYDTATSVVTTLAGGVAGTADGMGNAAQFRYPTALALDDVVGKVWVNDFGNFCIRSLDPSSGAVTTFAGTCGTQGQDGSTALLGAISSMVIGPRRDALYVCDYGVRRVDIATRQVTSILPNVSCQNLATDPHNQRVYMDGGGSITYFSDAVAGGPGTNPAVSTLVKPTPQQQAADFADMSANNGDDIYLLDVQEPVVYHYHLNNSSFDAVPFSGSLSERGLVDGPLDQARWMSPTRIDSVPLPTDSLYVSDSCAVREINLLTSTVSTVAGAPPAVALVDGPFGTGRMVRPIAVASDEAGNVYVADLPFERPEIGNVIRKIDAAGALTVLSGAPSSTSMQAPTDGSATTATFGVPRSMVYVAGSLYVVDVYGEAIRSVKTLDGSVKTLAGELGVSGYSEGVGSAARFAFVMQPFSFANPSGGGITTDGATLYVADAANYAVRKIIIATGEVSTLAGGTKGVANGTGKAAQFLDPVGITYDSGFLYVADGQDDVIRRIDVSTGAVTTLAGRSGVSGSADGDSTTATFNAPFDVLADGLGSLYVVETNWYADEIQDRGPGLLRRIDLATGVVTTIAGTRGQRGVLTGPAPSTLHCPTGLALTPSGDTLISDGCDGVVVRLSAQ
jgi:sugar lactone lactonase YvrE